MAPRYGSADSEDRRIQAGRRRTPTTSADVAERRAQTPTSQAPASTGTTRVMPRTNFTKVMDEYGQATPIWQWNDPATQAAMAAFDAGEVTTSGTGKYSDIADVQRAIMLSNAANARTTTPTTAGGGGGGGAGAGARNLLSAIQQYSTMIPDNTGMIQSGYDDLIRQISDRSSSQEALINSLFGDQTSQLERSNADMLSQLANMYAQATGEVDRQTAEGRQTIDDTTQRALEALQAQQNPYAGLQMLAAPAVTDPMAAYSEAVGAPAGGVNALQSMLQSQNAATGNAFGNLAQLLGASQTAAQQSRIGDVNVARAGAQQDLGANQRAIALQLLNQRNQQEMAQRARFDEQRLGLGQQALQARLGVSGQLNDILNSLGSQRLQTLLQERQGQQSIRGGLQEQLLALASQGVDVSRLMAQLGGR